MTRRLSCATRSTLSARYEAFFSGKAPPPPAFPSLTDGILRRSKDGAVQAPAGLLSPHGTIRNGERQGRFDEVVGLGFVLVSRSTAAESALGAGQRAFLDALGTRRVVMAAHGSDAAPTALVDLDAKFIPYMEQHGIDTMLVRPDFYLYGAVARGSEINQLVVDLAADLERHGMKLGGQRELQTRAAKPAQPDARLKARSDIDPAGCNGHVRAGWIFSRRETDAGYRPGPEVHFDCAAGWGMGHEWTLSAGGHDYQQATSDRQAGADQVNIQPSTRATARSGGIRAGFRKAAGLPSRSAQSRHPTAIRLGSGPKTANLRRDGTVRRLQMGAQ